MVFGAAAAVLKHQPEDACNPPPAWTERVTDGRLMGTGRYG